MWPNYHNLSVSKFFFSNLSWGPISKCRSPRLLDNRRRGERNSVLLPLPSYRGAAFPIRRSDRGRSGVDDAELLEAPSFGAS